MRKIDLVIMGGGPAGLSAAIAAHEAGLRDLLVIEQNAVMGGILNQCIHNGFGLHYFKEELTGPEYAHRQIQRLTSLGIPVMLNTTVTALTAEKVVTIVSEEGIEDIQAGAIILAMGCRERPRGAINIPGSRAAGVFSAGAAQEMVNLKGQRIGKSAVILGSGDIGLIMARRLTFEGMAVKAVVELMPYAGGLNRNIVQCLEDFDIPLYYNTTITNIVGRDRVEGVTIAQVDENRKAIKATERFIACDTVLLSVGLLPENELSRSAGIDLFDLTGGPVVDSNYQTSIPGIFACGNVLHVHDLVDHVSQEAEHAAKQAVAFLAEAKPFHTEAPITAGEGVRYVVPHYYSGHSDEPLELKFRPSNAYRNTQVDVYMNGNKVTHKRYRALNPGELEVLAVKPAFLTGPITSISLEIAQEVST